MPGTSSSKQKTEESRRSFETGQSADSGNYFSESEFSDFEECETGPVDLVNRFHEPQGNYIVSACCGVSPSGIFATTDSPRLPFFEIEFLCDVFFRFPIFFQLASQVEI